MPTKVANITGEHVGAFIADLLDRHSPATAATRYRSLQQFFRWLVEDGEVTESPMRNMHPPKVPEPTTPVLSESDLRALLATCKGSEFEDRRDYAILLTFIDTGMRLAELSGLHVADYDKTGQTLWVVGKGNRPRACPVGDKAALAIDRYLRKARSRPPARRRHRRALARPSRPVRPRRHRADGQAPRHRGRRRSRPPAPVPAHDGAPLAARRRDGGRPDGDCRLAVARDAEPVRRFCRRRTCA